jgi:hypothetical protein
LFVSLTLLCIGLAAVMWRWERAKQQRDAVIFLRSNHIVANFAVPVLFDANRIDPYDAFESKERIDLSTETSFHFRHAPNQLTFGLSDPIFDSKTRDAMACLRSINSVAVIQTASSRCLNEIPFPHEVREILCHQAIDEEFPESLARFSNLRKLRIDDGRRRIYENHNWQVLSKLPYLEEIYVFHTLTLHLSSALAQATNLRKIYLDDTPVSSDCIKGWDRLKNLEDLTISGSLEEADLEILGRLPKLKSLYIKYPWFQGSGFAKPGAFPELRFLALDISELTPEGWSHLAALPKMDDFLVLGLDHLNHAHREENLDRVAEFLRQAKTIRRVGISLHDVGSERARRFCEEFPNIQFRQGWGDAWDLDSTGVLDDPLK